MAKKPKKQRMTQSPAARARERKAELRKRIAKTNCLRNGQSLDRAVHAVTRAFREIEDNRRVPAKKSLARVTRNLAPLRRVPGSGVTVAKARLRRIVEKVDVYGVPRLEKDLLSLRAHLVKMRQREAKKCGR